MTNDERIRAVERFGFTTRQAAFLATVMCHSGVCLPRQYATFAGVAYGHNINRFFERLVDRGHVSACPCLHNRALVYHVHHRGLYAAIGQPQNRFRRPVAAAAIVPRLMLLDAVLEAPQVTWLAGQQDKVEQFTLRLGLPLDLLPRQATQTCGTLPYKLFPDAIPIGVESADRAVFLYPATRSSLVDFRPFLRRHFVLLSALPAWTLRVVIAPDERPVEAAWQIVVDREIGAFLGPTEHAERRVEWRALGHRYGHLSPLVVAAARPRRWVEQGEHVGERGAACSQPPWPPSPRHHARLPGGGRAPGVRTNNCWPCLM